MRQVYRDHAAGVPGPCGRRTSGAVEGGPAVQWREDQRCSGERTSGAGEVYRVGYTPPAPRETASPRGYLPLHTLGTPSPHRLSVAPTSVAASAGCNEALGSVSPAQPGWRPFDSSLLLSSV